MSDKQKVRKLILGLRLSLYQEAIKNCPVEPMDMVSYGSMNGPKILAQARKLMGEE